MNVWLWILVGLGAAGGLLLLALAIPVDLRFRITRHEQTKSNMHVRWLFGLVGRDISSMRKKPATPGRRRRRQTGLGALWRSGLMQHGLKRVLRLGRAVSVGEVRVRASVNAGDPAETGMAFAVIGPLCGLLAALPHTDIGVVPDFGKDIGVHGEVRGSVRVIPVVVVWHLVVFALSPATWRGVARLRRANRT